MKSRCKKIFLVRTSFRMWRLYRCACKKIVSCCFAITFAAYREICVRRVLIAIPRLTRGTANYRGKWTGHASVSLPGSRMSSVLCRVFYPFFFVLENL